MRKTGILMLAATLAIGAAACDRDDQGDVMRFGGDEIERARAGWPEALSAQIDSGNMAYRAGDYDRAATHFRRATDLDPQQGAAWFGLHMAEQARGDEAAAAEALHQAETVTPGLGAGHPRSTGELPEGHPPVN